MIALITGACGGLGKAMALDCAQRGYDLFLTDIRQDCLDRLCKGIQRQYDIDVSTKACDLTDARQVAELFRYIASKGLSLDMLLNVAGTDNEGGFTERSCRELMDIVKLNIEANLHLTHLALAHRRPESKFYLVFVSSLASLYPMPLKATYAASKRFLLDFSLALGQELKSNNIHVLSVCPGGLPTTPDSLEGIAAQGIWGSITTNRVELVAHKTIAKVLAGRAVYIPGLVNRILGLLGKFIPRRYIAKLLYYRWSAVRASRPRLNGKDKVEEGT